MQNGRKMCKKKRCPYYDRIEVPYTGPREVDLVIVGESPGREEVANGRPFVGPSGRILNAVLDSIGVNRNDVIIANACRCTIDKERDSIKTINTAMATCRPKLETLLKTVKPKVIVTLGAMALKQLTGKQKIMENRGTFIDSEEFGCPVFCTVHPAYVLRGASREFWKKDASARTMKENLLFIDFEQVRKYLTSGATSVDTSLYRMGTEEDIKQMRATAKTVALDFETTGLDLFDPAIRCLSVAFCAEEGQPVVFFADKKGQFPEYVNGLLADQNIAKLVASRPFEERCCRQKLGFEMGGKIHDVLVMAHLLDENYHSYSLEAIADIYTPLKGIKALAMGQRASLEELEPEQLMKYNAVDADATLRAFHQMIALFKKDKKLARYYAYFMQRIQTMFADVFYNGCKVDTTQLRKDEKAITTMIEQWHQQLLDMIPYAIKEKYETNLKLSRVGLVQDFLFLHPQGLRLKPDPHYLTPKTKKPQCSEAHLKQFDVPFIDIYLRMKKAEKVKSTYLKQLWAVTKSDRRIYPSTVFIRTVTGRTVMYDPTIQTIPQRGEFAAYVKRAIVADKGWLFGARDLGQSEIRIMGWMAQDPNILRALREGIDIHTMTASIVNHIPVSEVTKDQRRKAKGVNFGFIYGMGWWKFMFYAKENYGVIYTESEAQAERNAFFAKPTGYYKLPVYYKKQEEFVSKHCYVRSPLGRLRRLPGAKSYDEAERREAFRQAINMPIQSFSSDLGLIGMYLFWKELKKRPTLAKNVKLMWFIHDAIYFQARKKYFDEAMKLLKECMEVKSVAYVKKYFGVDADYPVTSDGKVGERWSDMHDWNEAA